MRKIDYSGINKAKLESAYISIFSSHISAMNLYWPNLRDDLRAKSSNPNANDLYPDMISTYFTMPYPKLVDVYLDYQQIMGNNSKPKHPALHKALKELFNYSGGLKDCGPMQPLIAKFFYETFCGIENTRMLLLRNRIYKHIRIFQFLRQLL